MKSIIINKSKAPDKEVRAIVRAAMRFMQCKGIVPVTVKQTRYGKAHGFAYKHDMQKIKEKWIAVDGGSIEVWFNGYYRFDPLNRADILFRVLCHEFGHIRDYQEGGYIPHKKHSRHDSRPCEQSVDNRLYELRGIENFWAKEWKLPEYAQDAILNFGIALEIISNKIKENKA